MASHFMIRRLPSHPACVAKWAAVPTGRAVIFVHGFGGSATDTWEDLPSSLPRDPKCAGTDVIFFGYDSLRRQAPITAALFRDFLNLLMSDPVGSVIGPSLPAGRQTRPAGFRYDKVVLVGHSLGAVIIREALVQAAKAPQMKPWLSKVSIAFFAPAHSGAKVLALASEALGAVKLGVAKVIARSWIQVLDDLDPRSDTLKKLKEDTQELLDSGDPIARCLKASFIVLGSDDKIVYAVRFCDDPGPDVIAGKGHTNVCKPDTTYRKPVELVADLL